MLFLLMALLSISDILSRNKILDSIIIANHVEHILSNSHGSVGNFTDRETTQRGVSTKEIVATDSRATQTTKLVIIVIMSVILLASVSVLIRLKCKINSRKVHVNTTTPAEERLSAPDVKPGRVTNQNSMLHSSAITAMGEQIQAQTKGIQQKVIKNRPKGSSVKDTLAKGRSSYGSRVTFCT